MKFTRFTTWLIIIILLATPLTILAQDDDAPELTESYVSEDGLLTVSYPADWFARENDFLYGAVIANSQDVFDIMDATMGEEMPPIPDGAVIIDITLAPLDTFRMFGMEVEEDMTSEEMLGIFLDFISGPPAGVPDAQPMEATATPEPDAEEATPEIMQAPEIGEIETFDFEDGRTAARATVRYADSDDVYMMFPVDEDIFAVVNIFAPLGQLTEDEIEIGIAIAESVVFTGTPDDLVMDLPEIEQSDVDPNTLDGEALVNERCTVCHERDVIDAVDTDEKGWTAIVDRMIGYGADLDSAERQAVIDYLVATH